MNKPTNEEVVPAKDRKPNRHEAKSGLKAFFGGAAAAFIALFLLGASGLFSDTGVWGQMLHMGAMIGQEGTALLIAVWVSAVGLLSLPANPDGGIGRFFARPLRGLIDTVHEGILFILGWTAFLGFFAGGLSLWVDSKDLRAVEAFVPTIFITLVAAVMIVVVPKLYNEVERLFPGWRSRAVWGAVAFLFSVVILVVFLK